MSLATKGLINEPFWEGALSRSSTATKSHRAVYSAVHDMFQSFDTFILPSGIGKKVSYFS